MPEVGLQRYTLVKKDWLRKGSVKSSCYHSVSGTLFINIAGSAPKDGYFLKYFIIDSLRSHPDTYLKGLIYKLRLCEVNVELYFLILIFGGCKVCFVDKWRVCPLADIHDGHARHVHDAGQALCEGLADLWRLSHNFVVDIDLVIDADAGSLPEALDAVRDLAAQTHAPELGRQVDIQHDGALAFRFAAPLWIVLDGVSECLDDL